MEAQLRDALQRHLNERLTLLNPSAERCRTFRQRNDYADARICGIMGGGQGGGNTAAIQVRSVKIEECAMLDGGLALCRYRTDAAMTGSGGLMGGTAALFNATTGGGGATHVTFARADGGWRFVQSYSACDMDGDRVSCR